MARDPIIPRSALAAPARVFGGPLGSFLLASSLGLWRSKLCRRLWLVLCVIARRLIGFALPLYGGMLTLLELSFIYAHIQPGHDLGHEEMVDRANLIASNERETPCAYLSAAAGISPTPDF